VTPSRNVVNAVVICAAVLAPLRAHAQWRREVAPPAGLTLPVGTSTAVWAGNTFYVSGSLDPDMRNHHDTESQTVSLLDWLRKLLESEHLTLGDVNMVHVYLHSDPAKDDKLDFAGMMAGWTRFFGTPEQPNKPARTTIGVNLPAAPRGALIEIDLVATRAPDQAAAPAAPAARDTSPAAVIRAYVAAFNAKDLDAMMAHVAPGMVWLNVNGDSVSVGGRGVDAFRRLLAGYFREVPNARSELLDLRALGPWVTAHERTRWSLPTTGAGGQSSVVVYEVRGGRVQRAWYYPAEP
jgi:enamine deaminase RidA (YjgF/YER057c/UK114 family)